MYHHSEGFTACSLVFFLDNSTETTITLCQPNIGEFKHAPWQIPEDEFHTINVF